MAADDLKVALGLLDARHVAGDPDLTTALRLGVLADWRASAGTRLAELQALHVERAQRSGELAFLLEPDLKEARGGLRDVHAIQAVAAAWVAPAPGPRGSGPRTSPSWTPAHALHEITGRRADRLVLQEQDEVARVLGLLDADALLRQPGRGRPHRRLRLGATRRGSGRALSARAVAGAAAALRQPAGPSAPPAGRRRRRAGR